MIFLYFVALHQSHSPNPSRDVRYKELVSTIINAANRKIRHKEKSGLAGKSSGGTSSGSMDDLTVVGRVTSSDLSPSKKDFYRTEAFTTNRRLGQDASLSSEIEITRYAAYHFDSGGTHILQSTENAKPCMRRTQSSESLLGIPASSGDGNLSTLNKMYYEDFTIRLPSRTITTAAHLSPQLLSQLHFKRQLQAKQQFLLQQPQQSNSWVGSSGAIKAPSLAQSVGVGNGEENSSVLRTQDDT